MKIISCAALCVLLVAAFAGCRQPPVPETAHGVRLPLEADRA